LCYHSHGKGGPFYRLSGLQVVIDHFEMRIGLVSIFLGQLVDFLIPFFRQAGMEDVPSRCHGSVVIVTYRDTSAKYEVLLYPHKVDIVIDLKSGEYPETFSSSTGLVRFEVEHKPFAEDECKAMLVEPAGTINMGETGGDMAAEDDVWT
jgi:hypothetical protein